MGYRDDLAAAHARIAALERELRTAAELRGAASGTVVDALRAENAQLKGELERLHQLLAQANERASEVRALREERERLVERVRVLQRDSAPSPAASGPPKRSPAAAAPPRAATRPTLWEHNRAQPVLKRGEGAGVGCPACRAVGEDVELVRKLGRFVKASTDERYESVACPRCLFTGLRRR